MLSEIAEELGTFTTPFQTNLMIKICLSSIFLVNILIADAQNTWVQKLSYDITNNGYSDTLTGVKRIEMSSDGSLYILAQTNAKNLQKLFKFYPNSHQLKFELYLGEDGMGGSNYVDNFRATSDLGFIVAHNYYDESTLITHGVLEKYSMSGGLQWSHQYGTYLNAQNIYDVIEKNSGGYYALIEDSLYTIDAAGNDIDSTGAISGTKFLEMTNGDLLVFQTGNQLARTDILGNVIWSENCSGLFAYDTSSVFIVNAGSTVKKIDALSGVQIWSKNYGFSHISEIEAAHDGGFMASIGYKPHGPYSNNGIPSQGILFRADSAGDTLWTRSYALPYYGLSTFKLMPNGQIATGGCYLSGSSLNPIKLYSSFCCMMNDDGSYPLAQTDYVSPSDANHDHLSYWVDDALETALAIGQLGTPRDTSLDMSGGMGQFNCNTIDIAIDWPASSAGGVNYKYADFDGNGIIDTNDVINYAYCYPLISPDSIALNYRIINPNDAQSIEEFCLVPVHDTIQPGENATYYMIMGSSVNPVDSIYGFSISYFINANGGDHIDNIVYDTSGFGTPGTNLWSTQGISETNTGLTREHILVCRTDFQNAFTVFDTLGLISFAQTFTQSPTVLTVADFKAALVNGTEIPFNVCAGNIYIDSSSVSINEKQNAAITIFPNPAADFLFIKNLSSGNKKISVLNSLGVIVSEYESPEKEVQINVADLPAAIYTIAIQFDNGVKNSFFIVNH